MTLKGKLVSAHTLKLAHQIFPIEESKRRPVVLDAEEPRGGYLCASLTLLGARSVDLIAVTIRGIVTGSSGYWIERCETRICWKEQTPLRAFGRAGFEVAVLWRVAAVGPVRGCLGRPPTMGDC